jgi:pimeloyl-ACP methyl ester carboxylesterase
VVLLLQGFPTSSFQYREFNSASRDRYRVIAPDLPGFGLAEVPEQRKYSYTFDESAQTILAFTDALGLARYALYVFDYGAPTGFRLAIAVPSASRLSFRKMAMRMKKAWETHGLRFGATGTSLLLRTAKQSAKS